MWAFGRATEIGRPTRSRNETAQISLASAKKTPTTDRANAIIATPRKASDCDPAGIAACNRTAPTSRAAPNNEADRGSSRVSKSPSDWATPAGDCQVASAIAAPARTARQSPARRRLDMRATLVWEGNVVVVTAEHSRPRSAFHPMRTLRPGQPVSSPEPDDCPSLNRSGSVRTLRDRRHRRLRTLLASCRRLARLDRLMAFPARR